MAASVFARMGRLPLREFAPVILLVALFVILSMLDKRFLTSNNLRNVLWIASPLIIAALGQAIVVIAGGIDLSQGSLAALAGMLALLAAEATGSAAVGWIAILLIGLLLGALNGSFIAWCGVPSFVATVGMLTYADGISFYLGGGLPIEFPPQGYSWFGRGYLGGLPAAAAVAVAVYIAVHLLMNHTVLGRRFYFVGDNQRAALLSGIPVRYVKFLAFTLCGLLTGISALLLTGRVDSAPPNLYPTLPFEAIAAVAIGGISMSGGAGRVWRAAIGALPVAILTNGLNLLGVGTYPQMMILGLATVVFVAAQNMRRAA
jgi:ribose transport system permease protein